MNAYNICIYFLFLMIFLIFSFLWLTLLQEYSVIHVTYNICVNWLLKLPVRLPGNSRLLVIKFLGSRKLNTDFWLWGGSALLIPALFKGQLYFCHPESYLLKGQGCCTIIFPYIPLPPLIPLWASEK